MHISRYQYTLWTITEIIQRYITIMNESKRLTLEERLNLAAQKRRKPKKIVPGGNAEDSGLHTNPSSKESLVEDHEIELNTWIPEDISSISRDDLIKALEPHFIEYKTKQKNASTTTTGDSSVFKLIKGKDEEIAQLTKKLEDRRKQDTANEKLLSKLTADNEKLNKNNDNLSKKLNESNQEISNLQQKYSLSEKMLEESTKNSHDVQVLESSNKQLRQSIIDQEKTIQDLYAKIEKLEDEILKGKDTFKIEKENINKANRENITALESQIEQLRIELENCNVITNENEDSQSKYQLIKEQFESSKANWSSIESVLNSKISTLEDTIEKEKDHRANLLTQLETKTQRLLTLEKQQDQESSENITLKKTCITLESKVATLERDLQNLKDDYNLLESKYNTQRSQYRKSSESRLNNSSRSINEEVSESWNDFGSGLNSLKITESNGALDTLMGQSSNIGDLTASDFTNNHELDPIDRDISFEKNLDAIEETSFPEDADELDQRNSRGVSMRRHSTRNSTQMQSNAQLVTKLGHEIGRLETEIQSHREKIERLQKEKQLANDEILKLIDKNNGLSSIKLEKEELEKQVRDLQEKLDTSLQILGEKTERVEELQNDVLDLKDMLHEQVKQMVDLQERLR